MQTVNIAYLQLVAYVGLRGIDSLLLRRSIAFYMTLLFTAASFVYLFNFMRWHREEILKDI